MNNKVTNISKNSDTAPHGLNYISDLVADLKAGQWMDVMRDDEDCENDGSRTEARKAP